MPRKTVSPRETAARRNPDVVALDAAQTAKVAAFRARLEKPPGKPARSSPAAPAPSGGLRLALAQPELDKIAGGIPRRVSPSLREKAPRSLLAEKCREDRRARPAPPGGGAPASDDGALRSPEDAALVGSAYRMTAADQEATTFYQADTQVDQVARYDYASHEYLLDPLTQPSWPGGAAPAPGAAPDWEGGLSADARAFLDSLATGLAMGFERLNLAHASYTASWYANVVRRDFPGVYPRIADSVPPLSAPLKDILARLYGMYLAFAPTIHPYAEFVARSVTAARQKEPSIAPVRRALPPPVPGQSQADYDDDRLDWIKDNLYQVETLGWPTILASAVDVLAADYPDLAAGAAGPGRPTPPGALLTVPSNYPFTVFRSPSVNLGLRLVYRQDWTLLGVQPGEIVKTIPLGPGQSTRISTTLSRKTRTAQTRETSQVVEESRQSTDTAKVSSEIVRETANTNTLFLTPGEGSFSLGGIINVGVTKAPSYEEQKTSRNADTSSRINESVRQAASRVQTQTRVTVSTEGETTFQQTSSMEISNPNSEIALNYEYLHLQHLYEVFTRLAEVDGVVYVAEDLPAPHSIDGNWVRRHAWILSRALLDESFRPALDEINSDEPAGGAREYLTGERMGELLGSVTQNFAKFTGGSEGSGGLTIPDIYSGALKSYSDWDKERQAADQGRIVREQRRRQLFRHLYDNILHYCRAIWMHEDDDQRRLRYRKRGITVPVWWKAGSGPGQNFWGLPGTVNVVPAEGEAEVPVEDVLVPGPPVSFYGNYAIYRYRGLNTARPPAGGAAGGHDIGTAGRIHLDWIMESLAEFYADPQDPSAVLDPDLARARADAARMTDAEIEVFRSPEKVRDIVLSLPQLRDHPLEAEGVVRDGPTREQVAEYLFRKRHSDRILFNSGNLYLNLRRGAGTAMEPFKLLHRTIDVLKAMEERDRLLLENRRLGERLRSGKLEDPDVEKVVRVEGPPPPGITVDPR